MANIFVYTPTDSIVPTMAERKATDLISKVAEMFERPLPPTVENIEDTARQRKADLFTKVASGEVNAADAATLMKNITQEAAAARRLAKQDPKILLMNGKPSSLKEIKRAFRNAESGTYVKVEALEGEDPKVEALEGEDPKVEALEGEDPKVEALARKNSGTITMFRP